MNTFKYAAVAVALAVPSMGHALVVPSDLTVVGYGAMAQATTHDDCNDGICTGYAGTQRVENEGGSTAYAEDTAAGEAKAQFMTSMLGAYESPTLKAFASAGFENWASSYTFGGLGYTNTSGGSLTIDLGFAMTGTITPGTGGYTYTEIGGTFGVLMTDTPYWYPDYGTAIYEGNYDDLAFEQSLMVGDSGSTSFTLADGETFFVVADLWASGYNGTADSFNSLTTSVNATAVGTPNTPAVPLPASVWLLGAALGGTGLMRKRKSKA